MRRAPLLALCLALVLVCTGASEADEVGVGADGETGETESPVVRLGAYVGTVGVQHGEQTHTPKVPVFIHIPKTGGTTIELSAARRGVRLGVCAETCPKHNNQCSDFDPQEAGYPTQAGYETCSYVHRPPSFAHGVVPNSFCVVRNPFDRLISEFHYERVMPWHKNPPSDTCGTFETWLNEKLKKVVTSEMVHCHLEELYGPEPEGNETKNVCSTTPPPGNPFEDCHLLPQSLYTGACETVLANEFWDQDVAPFMNSIAGVTLEEMTNEVYRYKPADESSLGALNTSRTSKNKEPAGRKKLVEKAENATKSSKAHGTKTPKTPPHAVDDACWIQMRWSTIQHVHRAYEADFRQFGYSANPNADKKPARGFTRRSVVDARLGRLGSFLDKTHTPKQVDPLGVANCLKAMDPEFLDAMLAKGFVSSSFLDELAAAKIGGRI